MAETFALLGYRFFARGPELRIEHEFVEPVVVRLEPFAFTVHPPSQDRADLLPDAEPRAPVSFSLCDVDRAAEHIRGAIRARSCRRVPPLPLPILHGHLLSARSRGLRHINPQAHRVQSAVLAVSPSVPRLACEPDFYSDPFLSRDVARYRAAACALVYLDDELFEPWCLRRELPVDRRPARRIAAMREWRSLFSFTGAPYRSLNRTLMNLPSDVPTRLLPHLRSFLLERPLTDGLGLTAVLLHVGDRRGARLAQTSGQQRKVLERADRRELVAAVTAIAAFVDRPLDADRVEDLGFAVRFLIDYPHPFRGSLPGLVTRAIRWHEELRAPSRRPAPRRQGERHVPDPPTRVAIRRAQPRPTARPPIPLPRVGGVEFLATVDRIQAEARMMENCIASYAASAVSGDCYLFHVRHAGEHASVEVGPLGDVRQAEGPRNSHNEAADWGADQLRKWGLELRPAQPPARPTFEVQRPRLPDLPGQLALWDRRGGPAPLHGR